MERWNGKVAVVTGSSAGIGAAIAKTLADLGVVVVGLARREERINKILTKTGGKIHALKCDVTKEKDIIEAFKWIEESLGGIDILVNNAGVLKLSSLTEGFSKDWRDMYDLNVMGLSICTREALRSMRKRGDNGHIFNINSIMGHYVPQHTHTQAHFGPYSASKFAVTALTESLRLELQGMKSNIRVTSISPGIVFTEMALNVTKQIKMKISDKAPPGFLDAQDIADAVIYALSTRPSVQVHELTIRPIGEPTSAGEF